MPSNHRIIRAEPITLPKANGDRDIEVQFDASGIPGLGMGATYKSPENRPVVSYRVNLQGEDPAHLIMRLNGDKIVDLILRETRLQTFHDVFEHDPLWRTGNTLKILVPDDQPGVLSISQIILVYALPE